MAAFTFQIVYGFFITQCSFRQHFKATIRFFLQFNTILNAGNGCGHLFIVSFIWLRLFSWIDAEQTMQIGQKFLIVHATLFPYPKYAFNFLFHLFIPIVCHIVGEKMPLDYHS